MIAMIVFQHRIALAAGSAVVGSGNILVSVTVKTLCFKHVFWIGRESRGRWLMAAQVPPHPPVLAIT